MGEGEEERKTSRRHRTKGETQERGKERGARASQEPVLGTAGSGEETRRAGRAAPWRTMDRARCGRGPHPSRGQREKARETPGGRRPRPAPGARRPPAPAAGARQALTREDRGGRGAISTICAHLPPPSPAERHFRGARTRTFRGCHPAALPPAPPRLCAGWGGGSRWISQSRGKGGHAPLPQPLRDSTAGGDRLGTPPWPPPSAKVAARAARRRLRGPGWRAWRDLGGSPAPDTEGKLGRRWGEGSCDPPGAGASRRGGASRYRFNEKARWRSPEGVKSAGGSGRRRARDAHRAAAAGERAVIPG